MTRQACRALPLTLLLLLMLLAVQPAPAADAPSAPCDAPAVSQPDTDAPPAETKPADSQPAMSLAPFSQEEFPLPRHDPRPLMQALIERKQPTDTTPFTFVAMGDRHCRDVGMFKLFEKLEPDFALLTGDIVNTSSLGTYRNLEREAGNFFRRVPTWAAPGNHEIGLGGANKELNEDACRRFLTYFGHPHDAVFSFTYANATFIGLPYEFVEGREFKRLEKKLAEARAAGRHIFVFGHQPYYTGRWRPPVNAARDAVSALFSKYKVVAVLGGHSHIYYRQQRDGVNYITNGTGGTNTARMDHNRLPHRRPGDAWYAGVAGGSGGQFHRPDLKEPIVTESNNAYFATVITVEGPLVTFRLIDVNGKEWDRAVLAGEEKTEPEAPADKTDAGATLGVPAHAAAP
jgi:3',5'-cyclic AMP phosphodiesterase CpdA